MQLCTSFNLQSKSQTKLKALYMEIFNLLACNTLSKSEKQQAYALLELTKRAIF